MKKEAKKLDPGKYARHSSWVDAMKNTRQNGHDRKGMFLPRERPYMTLELLAREKKRHIPPPGTYEASKGDKPLLG